MRHSLLILFASLGTLCASAQTRGIDVNAVLQSICTNNKQLQAMRQSNEATIMEMRSDNSIFGATSVEYSPFFRKGTNGIASSELVVSQEFKLPSAYASQRKAANLQQDVLNREYDIALRNIMLEAQNLCFDLQTALQSATLINDRMVATDSLLSICRKQMHHGNSTIMELNRIRLDSMNIQSDIMRNAGETAQLKFALQKLGASEATLKSTVSTNTIATTVSMPASADLQLANATLKQAKQEIKVTKQAMLPTFTLGYRRNTEYGETASNGPLIGVSVPLFSNSRKTKAARLKQSAAELEIDNIQHQIDTQRKALKTEALNLQQQLSTYDTALMHQTLATLMKAVNAGELSIAEYYVESAKIYSTLQDKLSVENRLNKVQAEIKSL